MPRYFFHVEDGKAYPDEEGTELSDLDAARIHVSSGLKAPERFHVTQIRASALNACFRWINSLPVTFGSATF